MVLLCPMLRITMAVISLPDPNGPFFTRNFYIPTHHILDLSLFRISLHPAITYPIIVITIQCMLKCRDRRVLRGA